MYLFNILIKLFTNNRALRTRQQKGGNAANTSAVLGILGNSVDFFGVMQMNDGDFFAKQASE